MIYLDNNATTKLDDKVLKSMLPYLQEEYGNASSIQHKMGRKANEAIEQARVSIAKQLKADPKEIIFTSGSTEAINMVLKGVYERYKIKGNHIITCLTEHKAVLNTCEQLEKHGASITYLPVSQEGLIDTTQLEKSITAETVLIAIMAANNETGVIQPLQKIAEICRNKDVLFFCDATQYIGKEYLDLSTISIDMLCFSGHKIHGPKGIGGLFIRRKSKPIQVEPLIVGGQQENNQRGGTYPVSNIVGLGKAFDLIRQDNNNEIENLRNYFEERVINEIEYCVIHGCTSPRLKTTSNICFKHTRGSEIMTRMPNVAISSGSACVSGSRDPSHVLKAMQVDDEDAFCSLRFSFSKYNSKEEIETFVDLLKKTVSSIRSQSPVWQLFKAGALG